MTIRRDLAAIALAILPVIALAQADTPRETCQRTLDSFRAMVQGRTEWTLPIRAWVSDGWCVAADVALVPTSSAPGFRIGRVLWRGDGIEAMARGGVPLSLDLRLEQVSLEPRVRATEIRTRVFGGGTKVDAGLTMRRDPGANTLTISRLNIDLPGDNTVAIGASLERVDLASRNTALRSLGTFGVTDLTLDIVSDGTGARSLMALLAPLLRDDDDAPEATLSRFGKDAMTVVADLPPPLLPQASKRALSRFLGDLPDPSGTVSLRVNAPQGLGAAQFFRFAMTGGPESVADVLPVLDGVTTEFTYEP